MGFFNRFSKTFLTKKDAEDPSPTASSLTTLSLNTPISGNGKQLSTAAEVAAVAVAEPPDRSEPELNSALFDAAFDDDLDNAFASLVSQGTHAPTESEPEELTAEDHAIVEHLFGDIAANYARPIKNFIFELKRGTATKDWVDICRPAMQGITRAAEGMGLRPAAQRMVDFQAALSLAQASEERVLGGELRRLILWCYEDLVKALPQAFVIGEEEQKREGIIINSLLLQIPDVGRVTIEKLYRVGLTSLDALYLAKKDDLAIATGISPELSESICLKFKAYRAGLEGALREVGEGQRKRLSEMVADLQRQHDGFVHASANEWSDPSLAAAKRDFRQQRQTCVLWINVLLAEIGELDLINELQKMSFERRIQRLNQYLATNSASD